MNLAEFFAARLDDDEQAALRWPEDEHTWQQVGHRHLTYDNGAGENVAAIDVTNAPCLWWERIYVKRDINNLAEHLVRHDPATVLADIAAKRAIIELYNTAKAAAEASTDTVLAGAAKLNLRAYEKALRALAAVYAKHPDYGPALAATP